MDCGSQTLARSWGLITHQPSRIFCDAKDVAEIGKRKSIRDCLESASGQNRKSSVGLGMSGVGGEAEVDFGRLEVCF